MAFSDYRWMVPATHGLAGFNGLDNWIEMVQDKTFWRSFGIAVRFSLMVMPLTLILSLTTAVLSRKCATTSPPASTASSPICR